MYKTYVMKVKKKKAVEKKLTSAQLKEFTDMFNLMDTDKSGTISVHEISSVSDS